MYNFLIRQGCFILVFLLALSLNYSSSAQCPTGFAAFNFQTQTEIDDFLVNYPSCDTAVNLVIDFDDTDPITNLDGLINIVHVKDALFISSDSLTDVRGLDNIVTIESSFEIFESERMRNFDGLPNLKTVGSHFNLQFTYLDSITGFGSIEHIGGLMHITYNSNLEYIAPLGTVDSLDYLDISFNDNLQDIKFLSPLAFVDGPVKLIDNYQLSNLMGLEDLSCVEALTIENCDNLSDITQLSNLQKLGTNADSHLNIKRNGNLFQLDGLQNIDMTTVSNLTIACSQQLNTCSLPNICAYLEDPANNATVIGNDIKCADRESILAECMVTVDEICDNGIDDDGDGLVDCDDPDVADDCCCASLMVDISPDNQITCEGEQVALSTSSNQVVTYEWAINGSSLTDTTSTLNATDSGTYTVMVTDACGNTASDQTDLTIFPFPILFPVEDLVICVGDTSFIEVESANVDTVMWFYNGDLIPGETDLQLNVFQAGEYVALATLGPCTEQVSIIVEAIDCGCPPLTLSPIPPVCADSTLISLDDYLVEVHSGVWSIDPPGLDLSGSDLWIFDNSPPGTYTVTFIAEFIPPGCPDRVSTELVLSETVVTNEAVTLCAGESYTLNGESYSMSGTYQQTIETSTGCDSVINLDLLVLPTETRSDTFNICQGSSIEIEGQTYSQEGTFTATAFDDNGCEYALIITIVVSPTSLRSETVMLCEGESIEINGQTYSQEGDYSIVEVDINGCESTLNLTIEVIENMMGRDTFNVCQGDTVIIDGLFYVLPGNYAIPVSGGSGCDTIRRFTIVHDNTEIIQETYFIKEGEAISVRGETYDSIGSYSFVLPAAMGCDTTLLINIAQADELVHYAMEGCNASSTLHNFDYSEFIPSYPVPLGCGTLTASTVYRNDANVNVHSCTMGVDSTGAMCVSSMDACEYNVDSGRAILSSLSIAPSAGQEVVITEISFWQQAPENYNWTGGSSGLNNYPMLFGVAVFQDGLEIVRETDLSTSFEWEEYTLKLGAESLVVSDSSNIEIRILGYCTVGNGSTVSAFDIDDIRICGGCNTSSVSSRTIAGVIESMDGSAMKDISVVLSSPGAEELATTNKEGLYAFQDMNSEYYYSVQPEKDDEHLKGISTLDIIQIQRHILGIKPFSDPRQIIAADINSDKRVNGIDLVELRKLLLGIYKELPENDSYRFVSEATHYMGEQSPFVMEESIVIPPSADDLGGLDFSAIKIGDVNNSSSVSAQNLGIRSGGYSILTQTNDDEPRRIDFYGSAEIELEGLQMILDIQNREVLDILSGTIEVNSTDYSQGEGFLKMSLSGGGIISTRLPMFTVILDESVSDIRLVQDEDFFSEIYNSELEEAAISIEARGDVSISTGYEIDLRVSPNPSINEAEIIFNSDKVCQAHIYITGVHGRVVETIECKTVLGLNRIKLNRQEFQNSGVYNVQLLMNGSVTTEKFVVLR